MSDETHPSRLSKAAAAKTRIVLTEEQAAQAEADWQAWDRQMAAEAAERRVQRLQFVAAALVARIGMSARAAQEWLATPLPEFTGRTPRQIATDDEAMVELMGRVSEIIDYVGRATEEAPASRLGLPIVIRPPVVRPDTKPDTTGDGAVLAESRRQAEAVAKTELPTADAPEAAQEQDIPRLRRLLQERAAAATRTPEAAHLFLHSRHPRLNARPIEHVVDQRTLEEAMALLERGGGRRRAS